MPKVEEMPWCMILNALIDSEHIFFSYLVERSDNPFLVRQIVHCYLLLPDIVLSIQSSVRIIKSMKTKNGFVSMHICFNSLFVF